MPDSDPNGSEHKTPRDHWIRSWQRIKTPEWLRNWLRDWIRKNPLWAGAHFLNLVFAVILLFGIGGGFPILPVVIFMCIIFVQVYTEPILSIPVEAIQQKREEIEEARAAQRNKWMVFAYSFMLISLLLTFYPFINSLSKSNLEKYLGSLRDKPIAVFIGCSLDNKAENLRCAPKNPIPPTADDHAHPPAHSSDGVGSAWAINIGGHIQSCKQSEDLTYGISLTCEVKDGLLIPLYFIIMALMGGSISLTRRLPELQKQAGSEHIATNEQPKLSQYEFREYLIFQMVQFISAPFLAILAYYLIEPSNTTNAVVLAFTAGFASETILLMIRSVANKITPESSSAPQYGAIAGIITVDGQATNTFERKNLEIFLTELPHQARTVADNEGFYSLNNVPVGEHSISIKQIDSDKIIKKDIVKISHAQVIAKKNITITPQELENALNK